MRQAVPLLLALLAGCASSVADKALPGSIPDSFKPSAKFTVRWHRNVGDVGSSVDYSSAPLGDPAEIRWRMRPDLGDMGTSSLQPALTQNAIYAANAEGKLVRLERGTGKQVWRVDSGFAITGGAGAGEGLVLVGGMKGEVAAFDESGKLRWKSKVSSEVLSAPQIAAGIVVVRSGDGRLAGLSAADGKRLWLYERITPALVVRSSAGVVIRDGTIYAGFAGGKLAAISLANGTVKWEATLSEPRGNTELERISDITSPPQVDGQRVCAVSFQGRVGCFNAAQGDLLWSRELSSDKGMAMFGKQLYVSTTQGEVLALDKANGSSLWKNEQLSSRRTSAPAVLGDYLVVGDYRGRLYALRRGDGSLAARLETDSSPILIAPVEMDGGLLVETYDGSLYSIAVR